MSAAAPFGFSLAKRPPSHNEYYVAADDTSPYAVGDPVSTTGNFFRGILPDSRVTHGLPHVSRTASGGRVKGVIMGIIPGPGGAEGTSIPAVKSRPYVILVDDSPLATFSIQADNVLPIASGGMYANFTASNPSGSVSGYRLDATSLNTSTGDLLIHKIEQNTGANSIAVVSFVLREDAQIPSAASGGGDVVGPASAVDGHVALFDGVTGKLLKDGGAPGVGTVTATAGALTANALVLGAGTTDTKVGGSATHAGSLTLSAGTATTAVSPFAVTQTWNASGVVMGADSVDITDTASAAASLVLKRSVNGTTVLGVRKDGVITTLNGLVLGGGGYGGNATWLSSTGVSVSGAGFFYIGGYAVLGSTATGTLQIGPANSASPTAWTLRGPGPRGGTDSNVAGATLTHHAGPSTGNATPATWRVQSTVVAASGTTAQTLFDTLTVQNGSVRRRTVTVATLPASPTTGDECNVSDATAPAWNTTLTGGGAVFCGARYNGSAWVAF